MDDYFDDSAADDSDADTGQHMDVSQQQMQDALAALPYVRIVEQPAKCGVRFRYECEGRISGAIPGVSSTTLQPTYPTIKVFNYCGRKKVVVSCVTKNPPFRAHPHNLVGKKSCRDGVCSLIFSESVCAFNNLGILCAKRKDIRERLRVREALRVDPFRTGFGHKSQAFKIIDLAVVRLCFQVYLEEPEGTGQFTRALEPVVSEAIYDKKAMSELSIAKLSHYSAPVSGGTDIVLLCDRVIKDDIQIRFYEESEDTLVWEAFAEFKANDIHKHFAISFRSPKYYDQSVTQAVPVNIQLRRPSDGGTSESLPFYLLPLLLHSTTGTGTTVAHKRQRGQRARCHVQQQQQHNVPEHALIPSTRADVLQPNRQQCILPRLLRAPTEGESIECADSLLTTMSAMNECFIDFDMNCIQNEQNVTSVALNQHFIGCHGDGSLADADNMITMMLQQQNGGGKCLSPIISMTAAPADQDHYWPCSPPDEHHHHHHHHQQQQQEEARVSDEDQKEMLFSEQSAEIQLLDISDNILLRSSLRQHVAPTAPGGGGGQWSAVANGGAMQA